MAEYVNYIKSYLIEEILKKLDGEILKDYKIKHSGGLDGFMSTLYTITMFTVDKQTKAPKERSLIAKFMKGDNAFRESSKSYIQFENEVFVYEKVIPYYDQIIQESGVSSVSVRNWAPLAYFTKFGFIQGLSDILLSTRDCVLVLENLKPEGYQLGPRLYLNRVHLMAMTKPLAEYHALTYVLRIQNDSRLKDFIREIVPLPFRDDSNPNDDKTNLYKVLYRVAFDRFFDYYNRVRLSRTEDIPEKLNADLSVLREKYFEEPTRLLEYLRTNGVTNEFDKHFAVILHGDFNRNNVLFRYKQGEEQDGDPLDAKMIDFQELRYGSPAIDLSFFMYMNTNSFVRQEVWMDLLKYYHSTMFGTLSSIVNGLNVETGKDKSFTKAMEIYSFENFYKHFSNYAFYGVMVCMHFLPWICCSDEECSRLSHLFETDMHGEEFRKLSIEAGGDEVNSRILNVIKHASQMGYLDNL